MTETGRNTPRAGLARAEPDRSQSFRRDRRQYYLHFMTPRPAARCAGRRRRGTGTSRSNIHSVHHTCSRWSTGRSLALPSRAQRSVAVRHLTDTGARRANMVDIQSHMAAISPPCTCCSSWKTVGTSSTGATVKSTARGSGARRVQSLDTLLRKASSGTRRISPRRLSDRVRRRRAPPGLQRTETSAYHACGECSVRHCARVEDSASRKEVGDRLAHHDSRRSS